MLELKETAGAVPVPVKAKVCGLPEALSATETVALRPLRAEGVKVAAITQVPPAIIVPAVRQSVPLDGVTSVKSPMFVPVMAIAEMDSDAEPLLVSVEVIFPLGVLSN